MTNVNDLTNPLRKFKLVFLGEQSGMHYRIDRLRLTLCSGKDVADYSVPLPVRLLTDSPVGSCTTPLTTPTRYAFQKYGGC
jgi:hypothetical protein